MCSAGFETFELMKEHCDKNPDETTTDEEIGWNNDFFNAVKGISQQALNDFKGVSKKQCIIYHPLIGFVSIPSNKYTNRWTNI